MKIFVQNIGDELVIVHNNKLCKIKVVKTSKGKAVLSVDSDSSYKITRGAVEERNREKERQEFSDIMKTEQALDQKAVAHALRRNSEKNSTNPSRLEMPEDDLWAPYQYRKKK
jgi:hypothetical protein